jgi:hypothetical protein
MKPTEQALDFNNTPHYSTHAVEFLEELARRLRAAGINPTLERFLAGALRAAVKFLLPANGFLFASHDYEPRMFELQRIPYTICALEFQAGRELFAEDSGLQYAAHRIALCFDPHGLPADLAQYFSSLIETELTALPSRCLAITAIYRTDALWGAAVGFVVIDLEDDRPILVSDEAALREAGLSKKLPDDRVKGMPAKHGLPSTFYSVPERARVVGQSRDEAYRSLYIDTLDEVRVTYEFLAAINCANVGAQDLVPSTKLNAKRLKSGKVPFYPYKVLNLSVGASHPGTGGASGTPRTHLRRGHIRRLGERFNNKILWINATLVNAAEGSDPYKVYRLRK